MSNWVGMESKLVRAPLKAGELGGPGSCTRHDLEFTARLSQVSGLIRRDRGSKTTPFTEQCCCPDKTQNPIALKETIHAQIFLPYLFFLSSFGFSALCVFCILLAVFQAITQMKMCYADHKQDAAALLCWRRPFSSECKTEGAFMHSQSPMCTHSTHTHTRTNLHPNTFKVNHQPTNQSIKEKYIATSYHFVL